MCHSGQKVTAKVEGEILNLDLFEINLPSKPMSFKESLSTSHPQFAGAHQHDCQEFLALLLDTMHEELRQIKGKLLLEYKVTVKISIFRLQ